MDIILFLIIGLIAGVIASAIMKTEGDWIWDLVIGVIGAVLGGWLFGVVGISLGLGLIGQGIVAIIGACIAIAIWRAINHKTIRG